MNYRNNYKAVAQWVMNNRTGDALQETITINALRNVLFDLAPIMSGLCSKAAIEAYDGKLSKMVIEHYNSRQTMARKIVDLAKRTNRIECIEETVKEACRAHRTTKEENLALIPYQKQPGYDWKEAYKAVGIELTPYDGPTYVYEYEGMKYVAKSKADLRRQLGVSQYRVDRYANLMG